MVRITSPSITLQLQSTSSSRVLGCKLHEKSWFLILLRTPLDIHDGFSDKHFIWIDPTWVRQFQFTEFMGSDVIWPHSWLSVSHIKGPVIHHRQLSAQSAPSVVHSFYVFLIWSSTGHVFFLSTSGEEGHQRSMGNIWANWSFQCYWCNMFPGKFTLEVKGLAVRWHLPAPEDGWWALGSTLDDGSWLLMTDFRETTRIGQSSSYAL